MDMLVCVCVCVCMCTSVMCAYGTRDDVCTPLGPPVPTPIRPVLAWRVQPISPSLEGRVPSVATLCQDTIMCALNWHPGSSGVVCAALKALRGAALRFGIGALPRILDLCAAVGAAMERFPDVDAVQVRGQWRACSCHAQCPVSSV